MVKLLVVLACAAAVMTAMSCVALAEETYFFWPTEDAWVNEASPEANYGSNTYLTVRDRSGLAEAFLRFSDADLLQLRGLELNAVSLCLYQYQGTYSPGDSINVHAVTSDWNEASLAWLIKPGYDVATLSSLSLTDGTEGWREWGGLQTQVASWVNAPAGTPINFGLALENGQDGQNSELFARFYSSEHSDQSLRPYLKVTTTPEPVSTILFGIGSSLLGAWKLLGR